MSNVANTAKWRLFLDDERFPIGDDWIICRSYDAACEAILERGLPFFVSFDHDLGEDKTGYDFALFLVDLCLDRDIEPSFDYYVHSQNPIGRDRIIGLLDRFKDFAS